MSRRCEKFISIFLGILLLPLFGFTTTEKLTEIVYRFDLPNFEIVTDSGACKKLQHPNWLQYPNQNDYLLPRTLIKIPIPKDSEYVAMSFGSINWTIFSSRIQLSMIENMSVMNTNGNTVFQFSGNTPALFTYVGTDKEFDKNIILVVANPFEYDEKTKKLRSIRACNLFIHVKKTKKEAVINKSTSISFSEKYNGCIILPKTKIPLFQEYKSYMEDRGIKIILYPLENIYSAYHQSNNPFNIRSFLKDFYKNHGIETVMLVGSNNTIPMKQFYPTGNKNEEPVLSDLYYSELTSNWDENPYPGKLEIDLVDFDPELSIGRIPIDSDQEISDYLTRVINYYQTIEKRKKSVLCAGSWISFKEDDGILFSSDMFDIDGGKMVYKKYETYFPSYSYEGFYETMGEKKSQVAELGNPLNYENIKGAIWQSNPLIQLISGHGNYSGIYRKIWSADKNKDGTAQSNEVTYDRFFDEKTPSSNSIYFVDSCSTCQPTMTNIGMQTIKKSGGGYLGFASEAYFIVSSTCKDPCDFETSTSIYGLTGMAAKYFNQQYSMGESIKQALKHYRDLCFVSLNKTVTQYQSKNMFATCYYGDPYLKLSQYPVKFFDSFASQGKGDPVQQAFGLNDISIAKSTQYDAIRVISKESLKNKKNYLYTISFDTNKDGEFDYHYKLGFLNSNSFVQDFYQRDIFLGIYGHYGFRYDSNEFWIQVPKTIVGSSYRYQISLTNTETNLSDTFLGNFPMEDTPPQPPSPPPPPKEITPPKTPTSVKGKILNGRVYLDWLASEPGSYPLAGYEIFRKEEGTNYSVIALVESITLSFVDQFVSAGKTYFYQIRAFDNQNPKNFSSFSSDVIAVLPNEDKPPSHIIPPTAPFISRIQNIDSRVYLGWSASVANSYPISGYEVYRKEDAGSYILVTMTDSNTLLFIDQFVFPGKIYTYQVRSFDNQSPQNFSLLSVEKSIQIQKTNPPEEKKPPQILPPSSAVLTSQFLVNDFSIQLNWASSLSGSFPISGYELFRSDGENPSILHKKFDAFTYQYIDSQIDEKKIYTYYILALDNQSPPHKSLPSNFVSVQVPEKVKPSITIRLKIGSNIAIVGDRFIVLPIEPFTYKDRTMVPIRFIGEAFGAKVNWTEDESKNGEGMVEIYLLKSDKTELFIAFHTLETKALYRVYKNGNLIKDQILQMDVPAFIVKPANRTVCPLRFIAEAFDSKVGWDDLSEEITIQYFP